MGGGRIRNRPKSKKHTGTLTRGYVIIFSDVAFWQTFEDLAALAETGQDENIHHTASDLITPDVKDDSYSTISSELVVYSFGKTQGKDLSISLI